MGVIRQILGTCVACYICLSAGITFTWPACTLSLFSTNETVLDRPMTETEISFFSSLSSIGALVSTPMAGYFLDIIGRKNCIIVSTLMHVICWCMVAVCSKVEVILTAMFLSGVGGAVVLAVPVFVSEICQENLRGTMTAGSMIFYAIGMLVAYVMGGTLQYTTMVYVCLSLAVIGVMALSMVKKTPMYLMKKGLEEEAAKSIAFYRSVDVDSKIVMLEMEKLRRAFNPQLDGDGKNTSPEEMKLNPDETPAVLKVKEPTEKLSLWKFIRKSRSTRQAMFVTLTVITAAIFQGLVVLQMYAEPLFTEAVPNLSMTVAAVILSLVTIISGTVAAYLTDAIGRRNLMIYSSLAASLCSVLLGSQLHVHWAPHWVTALFIYSYTASYSCGAGTVPFVLVAEVFLPEVKSFMSMFVVEWAWLCNFIILFVFNPVMTAIGVGPTFYVFSGVCLFSAVFSAVFQPETKGLPVDAIQELFLRRAY